MWSGIITGVSCVRKMNRWCLRLSKSGNWNNFKNNMWMMTASYSSYGNIDVARVKIAQSETSHSFSTKGSWPTPKLAVSVRSASFQIKIFLYPRELWLFVEISFSFRPTRSLYRSVFPISNRERITKMDKKSTKYFLNFFVVISIPSTIKNLSLQTCTESQQVQEPLNR